MNLNAKLIDNTQSNNHELPKYYEKALKYKKEGLVVLPVPKREKGTRFEWKEYQERKPTSKEIKEWFSEDVNIAVLCGCASGGLVVFDFDGENWKAVYDKFINKFPHLANTRRVITGSGKVHLWVRVPDLPKEITKVIRKFDGAQIELRGNGHYVIAPPSVHPCGKKYKFDGIDVPMIELSMNKLKKIMKWFNKGKEEQKGAQEEQAGAKIGPINDMEQKKAAEYFLERAITTANIGSRNGNGFWLACQLRDLGLSKEEARPMMERYAGSVPQEANHKYSRQEALTSLKSAFQKPARKPGISLIQGTGINSIITDINIDDLSDVIISRPYTDSGNAECFYCANEGKFYWVGSKKKWFRWDKNESRWVEDDESSLLAMRDTARIRYDVASRLPNKKEKKNLQKWARKSESNGHINSALSIAKAMMKIDYKDFDRDPYLLCCKNGVIDLKTGTLRPARPEDLLHFHTEIKFDPTAKCYRWKQFLQEIFSSNQELIDFIQKAVGYTLTGDVSEECFFICHGKGANGKSTFLGILYKLLGDFAHSASASTFKERYGDDPIPTDIAHMCGKRMISCIEVKESANMNEEKVKALTGGEGDILKGRFLFRDEFNFSATHKIWLSVNHLPKIKGTDDGIWRRIRLIPFNVKFPPHKQDQKLAKTLEAELPGILNWALEGCLKWQNERLAPVDSVTKATDNYRKGSDTVSLFLKDCTIRDSKEKVQASKIYQAFRTWCEETGEMPLTLREFSLRMEDQGIESRKISCNYYLGIRLLETNKEKAA